MENPVTKFLKFLSENNIENVSPATDSIIDLVSNNYDSLTQDMMRAMISCALEERDTNAKAGGMESELLGSWGVIIDAFKEQTVLRRERAGENMQHLIALGLQSGDDYLKACVDSLRRKGHVDSVLIDLVESSVTDIEKYPGNEDIKKVLGTLSKELLHSEWKRNQPALDQCTRIESSAVTYADISEEELVHAGDQLRLLVERCGGDAKKLNEEVVARMQGTYCPSDDEPSPVSLSSAAFQKVLDDNISACREVGYENKSKFLQFLKQTIVNTQNQIAANSRNDSVNTSGASMGHINHAPQFVDDGRSDITVSLVEENDTYIDVISATEALRISATGAKSDKKGGTINKKKKSIKSSSKKKVADIAVSVSSHLEKYGWAVCDNAIPPDLIKRVRVEAGLFTSFYEQSEIWVGKKADVGAQLSVPSVRGDKVLWMCGGHTAVEGVTRTVKTAGEVEPCRLEVKAQAPIRKFAAIRELVAVVDCLIYEMKKKASTLNGIFERSDAMLAIYPGEGARFARHIDNTTADGRRLTVLVYLNPSWTPDLGGALRIFTRSEGNEKSMNAGEDVAGRYMKAIDIEPLGGRIAMFYSAEIEHEVRPTFGMRHSITFWYYDQDERRVAVESSKKTGASQTVSESSIEAQRAAKEFISQLMGGDDIEEDGGLPSEVELSDLLEKLNTLDDETVSIISSITGAPSVNSFREGFPLLTVQDLKQMRGLFRRMGLDHYSVSDA